MQLLVVHYQFSVGVYSQAGLRRRSALIVDWQLLRSGPSWSVFSTVLAVGFHRKRVRSVFGENRLFNPDYYFRTATATF